MSGLGRSGRCSVWFTTVTTTCREVWSLRKQSTTLSWGVMDVQHSTSAAARGPGRSVLESGGLQLQGDRLAFMGGSVPVGAIASRLPFGVLEGMGAAGSGEGGTRDGHTLVLPSRGAASPDVDLGNTKSTSSQRPSGGGPCIRDLVAAGMSSGGIDTLEVGLYGTWPADVWESVQGELAGLLEESQAGRSGSGLLASFDVEVGGRSVQVYVRAAGLRKGSGRGAPYCKYVLEFEGVVVGLVDRAGRAPGSNRLYC